MTKDHKNWDFASWNSKNCSKLVTCYSSGSAFMIINFSYFQFYNAVQVCFSIFFHNNIAIKMYLVSGILAILVQKSLIFSLKAAFSGCFNKILKYPGDTRSFNILLNI